MPLDIDKLLQNVDMEAPPPPNPTAPTQEKGQKGPVETSGLGYVARQGAKAFGEAVGRKAEAAAANAGGESFVKSALRMWLPGSVVDQYFPDMMEEALRNTPGGSSIPFPSLFKDKSKNLSSLVTGKEPPDQIHKNVEAVRQSAMGSENFGDILTQAASNAMNMVGVKSPDRPDIGPAPGAISKNLGRVASFAGTAVGSPELGAGMSVPKYAMSTVGSAEGSEIAGDIAHSVATNVMDASPETAEKARMAGEIGGGGVGGLANVARYNAVTLPFKKAADAAKIAAEAKRAGDERGLVAAFSNTYGTLKEDTKPIMQQTVNEIVASHVYQDLYAKGHIEDFNKAMAQLNGMPVEQFVAKEAQISNLRSEAAKLEGKPEAFDQLVALRKQIGDLEAQYKINPRPFTLAQKTATPSLVASQRDFRPKTPEETQVITSANQAQEDALIAVGKRVTGDKVTPDAKSLARETEDFRKQQNLYLTVLNNEGKAVADTTPALGIDQKVEQGQQLKDLAEKEWKDMLPVKDQWFNTRNDLADQAGIRFPLTQDLKDNIAKSVSVDSVLKEALSKKDLSMKELGDVLVRVNGDLHAAQKGIDSGSRLEARNLSQIQKEIEGLINERGTPEVIAAHNQAVENFKKLFVPRFYEGANVNLTREGTTAFPGRERVEPQAAVSSYLKVAQGDTQVSASAMEEFNNLFGGKIPGTKPVPEAYNLLWSAIEDHFNTNLLKGGTEKFTKEGFEGFMHKYEAPLNELPALRDKLTANAEKILDLQAEAKRVKERFDTIFNSPITEAFGPDRAAKVIIAALSDPRKMGQLIGILNRQVDVNLGEANSGAKSLIKEIMLRAQPFETNADGSLRYNRASLEKLLDSGKGPDGSVGGLQVALRAALGRAEGDAQLERLRALSIIGERHELTSPRFLRPQEQIPTDLFKAGTGQTGASSLAMFYALGSGRVGAPYILGTAAGRFFNQELKQSLNEAQIRALYDPETAKAIIHLAQTPPGQPAAWGAVANVLKGMGNSGVEFLKSLLEHGQVAKYVRTSAGLATIEEERDRASNRPKREQGFSEPSINRIRRGEAP